MPPFIIPAIQAGAGIAQTIFGGIRAKKAQKELEKMQSPTYTPSQSITDVYNKALQRYNTNPYQSAFYKNQAQQVQRGVSQGLNALQGRGMALAGVNALVQGQNDAMLQTAATAEQQQAQRFNDLQQAAQQQAGQDQLAYQYNSLMPFERKSGLLSAKAAGGAATMNAGLSNIFGGLQSLSGMGAMRNQFNNYNQTTV